MNDNKDFPSVDENGANGVETAIKASVSELIKSGTRQRRELSLYDSTNVKQSCIESLASQNNLSNKLAATRSERTLSLKTICKALEEQQNGKRIETSFKTRRQP